MISTPNDKKAIELLDKILENKIKKLVKGIDEYLTQNSEGIAYVPKPMLKVFEGFSSFIGKKRFRTTQNVFGYALPCPKARNRTDFSSYDTNNMIHHLFLAIAYHGYDYNAGGFGLVLPNVVNSSIYNLAYWGVNHISAKRSNEKPLTSINTVFSLITSGHLGDYVHHVEGTYKPNLSETVIDRVVNISVDLSLNLSFIVNDEHCIALVNKKGFYAKVSDEVELCVDGNVYLLTPDGILVTEMLYSSKTINKYNFKDEVYKFLTKTKK